MIPEKSDIVVVTGASGYFGTALAVRLRHEGWRLRLVSRPESIVAEVSDPATERVLADLGNELAWERILDGVSAVVHLSARTDLRSAERDPEGDRELNVEPVRALLRAASRRSAPPLVLFASAATITGVGHSNPADETIPDNPISVYDRHKLHCEELLLAGSRAREIEVCILRLTNVYGYGVQSQNTNRGILNLMMRRAVEGVPLTLYGDGQYVRDFLHIDDAVDAFARALESGRSLPSRRFLIASGHGQTLSEAFSLVANEASAALNRPVEVLRVPEPADMHPIERRSFVGDSTLFRRATGWSPKISFSSGVRATIARMIAAREQRP